MFHKKEFHYLNVPRIGLFMAYDVFDCTFKCLSNQLCFSVNLAASKGAEGKLWCELLPSDRYTNFTQFKENKSVHHFFIEVRNIFNADHFDWNNVQLVPRDLFCIDKFSTLYRVFVLLRFVKTEERAWQSMKMTRLNVSVKQPSLENIATQGVSDTFMRLTLTVLRHNC